MSQERGSVLKEWTNIPSESDEVKKYGYPLHYFRTEKFTRTDVVGKKNKKTLYSISGFRFRNLMETKSSIEETFIECINAYVKEVMDKLDAKGKTTTLVMHHNGFNEIDESLFINLNKTVSPGDAVMSFIERFAQSNDNIKLNDEMDFDLWISN